MRTIAFLVLALSVIACSSPAQPALDPIFVVLCADIDPSEEPHPCCTGFAMGGQVVTANHCVPDDYARLVSRQQWLNTATDSEIGHVVARDMTRDIAWLDAPVDEQLERGAPVVLGASISMLTVSGPDLGTAYDQSGNFWRTDADTALGDSGAAVVDADGYAVGVLTRCLVPIGEKACRMDTGIFAELP